MDNIFLQNVDRERVKNKIEKVKWKIENSVFNFMIPITRSLSKFMDRENVPEKDREKMIEAAYALIALSKSK